MPIYQIRFHRYDEKSSTRTRISGVMHNNAEDFNEAFGNAVMIMRGMSEADPNGRFSIVSILTHDYRGIDCDGGSRIWETSEELSNRVKGPPPPPDS